jgi:hypothetical protein
MNIRMRLLAAPLAAALVLTGPVAAFAESPSGPSSSAKPLVDQIRARCLDAVDARLHSLDTASAQVKGAAHLSDGHRTTLQSQLQANSTGLRALEAKIQTETDPAKLKSECASVINDFRIDELVIPRTRFVVEADNDVWGAGQLSVRADQLQKEIDAARKAGKDLAKADKDLAAMRASIANARSQAFPVPDSVLGFQPKDWNADHHILDPAKNALRQADAALASAAQLGETTADDLEPTSARCVDAITTRLAAISAESHRVAVDPRLSDAHRTTLQSQLQADTTGLTALEAKIKAEIDPVKLNAECRSIFEDFRIFALVLPRTELVIAADNELFTAKRLAMVADQLQVMIDAANAAGVNTTKAAADLAALRAAVSDARSQATPIADAVLRLEPSDWNANPHVLDAASSAVHHGRDDLHNARDLAERVLADLVA